jgi:hypothetical protein
MALLLLFLPARYSESRWLWGMCALYLAAKILEAADSWIGRYLATGGHPWKHVAAAGALFFYCLWGIQRRPYAVRLTTLAARPYYEIS